jgi:hypothetical protein
MYANLQFPLHSWNFVPQRNFQILKSTFLANSNVTTLGEKALVLYFAYNIHTATYRTVHRSHLFFICPESHQPANHHA